MAVDAATAARLKPQDTQRIIRALGIYLTTKIPLSIWQEKPREGALEADILTVGLLPDRQKLHARIEARQIQMFDMGVLSEVKALYDANLTPDLPALTGLGVADLYAYFTGEKTLSEAKENMLIATRQYAKRQCTWVKNSYNANILVENPQDALPHIANWVKNKAQT